MGETKPQATKMRKLDNGSTVAKYDPGEPSTGVGRVSVTEIEARILAQLTRGAQVLEIGTGLGISTQAMATTAALVTTCDIDVWVHENIFPTLTGVRTIVSLAPVASDKFDVIFIDGDHTQAAVEHDLDMARAMLARDGMIVLHDTKMQSVQKALFQSGLTAVQIDTTHGIGLVMP